MHICVHVLTTVTFYGLIKHENICITVVTIQVFSVKTLTRFVSLANARHREIHSLHEEMVKMNNKLIVENSLASKLRKDLEHEKIVLEERKTVFIRLFYNVGLYYCALP